MNNEMHNHVDKQRGKKKYKKTSYIAHGGGLCDGK